MCNTHLEEKINKPELVDFNVGAAFVAPDWFASVRTANLFSNIRVGYTCVLSKTLNFGALVNYRVFQNQQSVLIGALWRYSLRLIATFSLSVPLCRLLLKRL
jgi:spore coat protein U-like protein